MGSTAGGTGIGVNLTPVPTSNVSQLNAETENAKKAIAMVVDSLKSADTSFVEQSTYEYHNRNPSRPKLSHPMQTLRMGVETQTSSDEEAWQGRYDNLVENLPDSVKTWFKEQIQVSYFLRDAEYYAFNAALILTSQALVWFESATRPQPPESAALERAEQNLFIPYIATSSLLAQGKEALQRLENMLDEIGNNDPNFDKLLDYFMQASAALENLEKTMIALSKEPPLPGTFERLFHLSNDLKQLKETYHRTDSGDELHMLGSMIDTLSIVTAALTLGYGPASVLWMLTIGGNSLTDVQVLSDKLTNGLMAQISEDVEGKSALLSGSLQMLFTFSVAGALSIAENGVTYLPKSDEHVESQLNFLALDYLVHIMIDSKVLSTIITSLAETIIEDEKARKLVTEATYLATLAMLPLALEDKKDYGPRLFESLSEELTGLINQVSTQVEDKTIGLYLQQAKIALESGDFAGYCEACYRLLESYNISPESLKKDFGSMNELGTLIIQAVTNSPGETNRLTTIHAA